MSLNDMFDNLNVSVPEVVDNKTTNEDSIKEFMSSNPPPKLVADYESRFPAVFLYYYMRTRDKERLLPLVLTNNNYQILHYPRWNLDTTYTSTMLTSATQIDTASIIWFIETTRAVLDQTQFEEILFGVITEYDLQIVEYVLKYQPDPYKLIDIIYMLIEEDKLGHIIRLKQYGVDYDWYTILVHAAYLDRLEIVDYATQQCKFEKNARFSSLMNILQR